MISAEGHAHCSLPALYKIVRRGIEESDVSEDRRRELFDFAERTFIDLHALMALRLFVPATNPVPIKLAQPPGERYFHLSKKDRAEISLAYHNAA